MKDVYFAYHSFAINVKIELVKELAVRLQRGADLKREIERICKENSINTAVVLSGVGRVYEVRFRRAKAEGFFEDKEDYEIVSLNGTVSNGHAHIHIALSDDSGKTIGGHLMEGCLINTTCELVLGIMEEYKSVREYDEQTGYDEIVFEKVR